MFLCLDLSPLVLMEMVLILLISSLIFMYVQNNHWKVVRKHFE